MIVRTYGRRNRCISRSCSDSSFDKAIEDEDNSFRDPLSQDSVSQDIYNFSFSSSQDSTPWAQFDSDSQPSLPPPPPACRPPLPNSKPSVSKSKKSRNLKVGNSILNGKAGRSNSMPAPATATLMETQEFGEMMEHVDEVNFALDGLRKGQPARIRRASLLSLLSICSTATKRRLLRTHGMAKTILDAILSLSLDDSPSTLAAAALFYVLASDGEGEQLLDSPICIRFLLKLLSPSMPASSEEKKPSVGSKLLALCRDNDTLGDKSKRLDTSSTAINSKVQEILLSYKEIQSSSGDDGAGRPELTPKWIALLTVEKACVSTVSIEDTSATVRKVGGNFKETLRELGGLDAVFDVAAECHSIMERWSEDGSVTESQDDVALQTVVLLLKCFKIMENATFLSKDNQNHLLEMDRKSGCKESSLSFTGLVVSAIKILSDLSFHRSSPISSKEKSHSSPNGVLCDSDSPLETEHEAERDGSLSRSSPRTCHSTENASNGGSLQASQKRKKSSTLQRVYTVSSCDTSFSDDVNASVEGIIVPKKRKRLLTSLYAASSSETSFSFVKEDKPSTSSSCNGTSKSSGGRTSRYTRGRKTNLGVDRRSCVTENTKYSSVEEFEDPFAFDGGEVEPTKWDKLSKRKGRPQAQKISTVREPEVACNLKSTTSESQSNNRKECHSCETTCSPSIEVDPILLSDCILAAVKVLMNLTNDNPLGCNQIAACGGLETLSALISGLYPAFSMSTASCSQTAGSILELGCSTDEDETGKHFTDHEIDYIVAILGLLVNLVEKDSLNRSRLAATRVSMPTSGGSGTTQRDIIPLLCSIFLANQGAGETSEDRKMLPWDEDDNAMLQGEQEAEKMIIEAYAALLLAFLSTESKNVREAIARCLPDHNLEVLVPVLERFVTFHLTLNMISPETHAAVSEVIESLKGN